MKTYADKLKNTVKDTVKKNEDLKKYADDLSDRNNNILETNQKLDNEYRRMQHKEKRKEPKKKKKKNKEITSTTIEDSSEGNPSCNRTYLSSEDEFQFQFSDRQ